MATERIIQCIGPNEEDRAHLRLLLRVARKQLRDEWTWGTEARADLVFVDTRRLIGDSAMRRASQRGIACAQVIEPGDPKPVGLFLRKPFRRDAFVMLLNRIGHDAFGGADVDIWSDEFLELDLGSVDLSELEAAHPGTVSRRGEGGDRRAATGPASPADPSAGPSAPLAPDMHDDDGDAVFAEDDDATAVARDEPDGEAFGDDVQAETDYGRTFESEPEAAIDPNATYPLDYYLEKGLLGGPARIALRDVPALVLDPDEQMFWARGLLRALEPYAREPLRFGDWQRLDRDDLEEARRGIAARPYSRLIWMDRFIHSDGFLARHFDPAGTYRLTNRFDLSVDYPRAFRVAAQMIAPRRLHEIARASAVGLAEVFDVVNAYEAVGYVEWTPLQRVPGKS